MELKASLHSMGRQPQLQISFPNFVSLIGRGYSTDNTEPLRVSNKLKKHKSKQQTETQARDLNTNHCGRILQEEGKTSLDVNIDDGGLFPLGAGSGGSCGERADNEERHGDTSAENSEGDDDELEADETLGLLY